MANPENLIGKGFDARPENIHKGGRPKGTKNRSTVLREIYEMVINGTEPLVGEDGVKKKMTVEEAVMRSLVAKALAGDVPAIREAQDTVYGKITENVNHSGSLSHDEFVKQAKDRFEQDGLSE